MCDVSKQIIIKLLLWNEPKKFKVYEILQNISNTQFSDHSYRIHIFHTMLVY